VTERIMMVSLDRLPLPYRLDDSTHGPVCIESIDSTGLVLSGCDNYGQPALRFAEAIAAMSDAEFTAEAVQVIYQSARTQDRKFADWHWQAHACWYEARRRGDESLYEEAYERARRQAGI
jgi:hypothetical protein